VTVIWFSLTMISGLSSPARSSAATCTFSIEGAGRDHEADADAAKDF
jgi:hypothetical protein